MPGLVNRHTHAPTVALRGLAEDLPTEGWFNDVVGPVESNLTAKDAELGARLACGVPGPLPWDPALPGADGLHPALVLPCGNGFNRDFGVTLEQSGQLVGRPGLSCFLRDGERVFHVCSTYGRGLDGLGSTTVLLDLAALGRQGEREEPGGRASALGAPVGGDRIRYHGECEL